VLRKRHPEGRPVLAGAASEQRRPALLDAVVDYCRRGRRSRIQGHLPHHDATHALRQAAMRSRSRRSRKIMTDPYVGSGPSSGLFGVLAAGPTSTQHRTAKSASAGC